MNTSKSLNSILHDFAVNLHPYARGEGQASDYDKYKAQAVAAIVEAVEGLIGPDEEEKMISRVADGVGVYEVGIAPQARNQLRAELRLAIKEWQDYGGTLKERGNNER